MVRKQKMREYKISAIKTKACELFGSVGFRAFVNFFYHHHRRSAFIFTVLVNKLSVSVCVNRKRGWHSRHGARFELLVVRHNLKVLNWVSALNRLLYATCLYFIFNLARFNFYLSIFKNALSTST